MIWRIIYPAVHYDSDLQLKHEMQYTYFDNSHIVLCIKTVDFVLGTLLSIILSFSFSYFCFVLYPILMNNTILPYATTFLSTPEVVVYFKFLGVRERQRLVVYLIKAARR